MKTTTQLLREYKETGITDSSFDTLEYIETIHLRLAYDAGKRDKLTFDQWYDSSFQRDED